MKRLLEHPPSPLQLIRDERVERRGLRLLVKRDDQLCLPVYPGDCSFSGNKWRKLKYNLQLARDQGHTTLLTYGGAFSNHLAACASAGRLFGFKTIGVVRGEDYPENPTLRHARQCGMNLHFIGRSRYRLKESPEEQEILQQQFGPFYRLPEGGTNKAAMQGCAEWMEEIQDQLPGEHFITAVAAGTGGSLGGLQWGSKGRGVLLGFSALKGDFLGDEIARQLVLCEAPNYQNWSVIGTYHFGAYARSTPELLRFMIDFQQRHQILLEHVYTGKLFFGLFDQIEQGVFSRGETLVAIHSGGLQGLDRRLGENAPLIK